VVGLDQAESVPFMRFFVVCDFMLGEICPWLKPNAHGF
jgi:hypothetical protein